MTRRASSSSTWICAPSPIPRPPPAPGWTTSSVGRSTCSPTACSYRSPCASPTGAGSWYSRVHHILLDGYGSTAFTERVAQVYTGRILGIEVQPSRAGSLADLYADDLAYRSSTRFERDREHWAGRLADLPAPIRLGNPGAGAPTRSRSVGGDLDQRLLDAVSAFCADNNVTIAAVATAATALYLSRMSGPTTWH